MPDDLNLIRINDSETVVYRIFPPWFLEESIRLKRLTLVQPRLWEDPYEILGESVALNDASTVPIRQIFLEQYLLPIHAQAWSRTSESDTLLRAYSRVRKDAHAGRNTTPGDEGVRVRSTAGKLLRVFREAAFGSQRYF